MPRASQYSSMLALGANQSLPELLIPQHPQNTGGTASLAPSGGAEDDAFTLQVHSHPQQSWRSVSVSRRGEFSKARRRWHSFALLSTTAASPAIPKTHGSPPPWHSTHLLPPSAAPVPHRHAVKHEDRQGVTIRGHRWFRVPMSCQER